MSSPSKHIKLHVIGFEGSMWSTELKPSTKIEKLKNMSVSYFCGLGLQEYYDGSGFRLLSISKKRSLKEELTLIQDDVGDNEELLLMKCRPDHSVLVEPEENSRGPSAEEIYEATKGLEMRNCNQHQPTRENVCDDEFRKILISLIQAAARLLSPSSDGIRVFNLLNEKMKKQGEPAADNPAVKQLTDMGFPHQKAILALRIKRMNLTEATEWLLQQGSDSEADDTEEQPHVSTSKPQNICEAFQGLLQSLLSAKKRQFTPNSEYLRNLKDMGFEEREVREALRISGNNQSAACAWLLTDKKDRMLDETEQGLHRDSPIYKAIMKNPIIQMNLTKPKVLFAFLTILENPSAVDLWINDEEISPVLHQIFKIHHTEKLSKQLSNDSLIGPNRHFQDASPDSNSPSQLSSLLRSSDNDGGDDDEDEEDAALDDDDSEEGTAPLW